MRFTLILLLAISSLAFAHEGQVNYNQINLTATATGLVDNDTITARLFRQEQGTKTKDLADTVNKDISWGINEAKKNKDFKVQTRGYSTNPVYKKGTSSVSSWQVRQEISIESKDMTALSEALSGLQTRLNLSGLQYSVSPEKRSEAENGLISEALAAFKSRAKIIASNLGYSDYKIVNVNVNSSGGYSPYQRAAPRMEMAMSSKVAAPAIEAGEQSIQVNVNGTIELQ